jgi:molecular chaperone GrpE (heat shock protein)
MLTGGAIFSWWLLLGTARLVIKGFCSLKKLSTDYLVRGRKTKAAQPCESEEKAGEPQSRNSLGFGRNSRGKAGTANKVNERLSCLEEPLRALKKSGWQSFGGSAKREKEGLRIPSAKVELKEPSKVRTESLKLNAMQPGEPAEHTLLHLGNAEQMTQTAQQAAVEHSEPLNNTLTELTQEVAAIREYARQQQDRVKKLQDGYDWNIIRNFCLRIIRCIYNLEGRIGQLSKQDTETINLEAARDELVFALESSGVEQFEPEINSDYRGQERCAEAVKDKQRCGKPNMTGKIAKVIRPGYQYVIDEENAKVVRTAQVKIYN